MKSPIDNFNGEQERIDQLFDLADEIRDDGTWCLVGHHLVAIGSALTSPSGHMVCRDCLATAAGQKEMREFDPTA